MSQWLHHTEPCCSLLHQFDWFADIRCPQIVWPGRAGQGSPRPRSARNRLKRSRSVGWAGLGWAGQGLTTLLGCATSPVRCGRCVLAAQLPSFLLFPPLLCVCPSWIWPAASHCNQSCCCPHSSTQLSRHIRSWSHVTWSPLGSYNFDIITVINAVCSIFSKMLKSSGQ